MSNKPLRLGIVAGEASGDQLGAGLIRALRARVPDLEVEGIAGPKMLAEGAKTLFPQEKLAVMGLVEVLRHIPTLLRIRRALVKHFLKDPPDIFIGIDSPGFNLDLELTLKSHGIKTVHYVSPQVWAWRRHRVRKIARAVDHLLVLFPFEADFYKGYQIPHTFVGHPLAQSIPDTVDQQAARVGLGLPVDKPVVALLPGSRQKEIQRMGQVFIETARWCLTRCPELVFVAPMINAKRREQFDALRGQLAPDLPITVVEGQSQDAMAAADVVLLTSGTASFEAMLFKRPMVVAYRMSALSYWIAKAMVKVDYFSLPNLLTEKPWVSEYLQGEVTPENLGHSVLKWLDASSEKAELVAAFGAVHQALKQDADEKAAEVVCNMLTSSRD